MPKGPKGEKRPADVIGNAVKVMKIATGEETEDLPPDGKDPAAVSLGRKGGKARAEKMTAELRKFGPLKPARIRERLADVGFTSNYNDNYFYTVISRLSKSGAIVRTPDKQLAVPDVASASQGNGSAMH